MNQRIQKLFLEAQKSVQFLANSEESKQRIVMERFAELIVDECANWINENVGMIDEDARADLHKHFGVEK